MKIYDGYKIDKAVCFSLWGEEQIYLSGIENNINLIKELLPDWETIIYCDKSVPKEILNFIEKKANLFYVEKDIKNYKKLFWRIFYPLKNTNTFICRDLDSRIGDRDVWCINEWITSNKEYHIIRDGTTHDNCHKKRIQGGLFGIKSEKLEHQEKFQLLSELESIMYNEENGNYSIDEDLLNSVWYDRIKNKSLIHATIFNNYEETSQIIPYFLKQKYGIYMGQKINENNVGLLPGGW